MSNEAITWAYRQPITSGAKFVLVALADMADEAHSCYPGQAKLAAMTGQGERTVRRQLAELEIAGHITRERRFNKMGHRTSDRYVLPVDADVLSPTGQNDQRSYGPVAKSAGGHPGLRPETTDPTGQSGQVTQRRTLRTPQPPAKNGGAGGRKRAHCPRHPRHNSKCSECVRLENPPKERPPHCGECDPDTRMLLDADNLPAGHCPRCHPLRVAS